MNGEQHPYHSIGARRDRATTWKLLDRIASSLERIADALETTYDPQKGETPAVCECGHGEHKHERLNEGDDLECQVCDCLFFLSDSRRANDR